MRVTCQSDQVRSGRENRACQIPFSERRMSVVPFPSKSPKAYVAPVTWVAGVGTQTERPAHDTKKRLAAKRRRSSAPLPSTSPTVTDERFVAPDAPDRRRPGALTEEHAMALGALPDRHVGVPVDVGGAADRPAAFGGGLDDPGHLRVEQRRPLQVVGSTGVDREDEVLEGVPERPRAAGVAIARSADLRVRLDGQRRARGGLDVTGQTEDPEPSSAADHVGICTALDLAWVASAPVARDVGEVGVPTPRERGLGEHVGVQGRPQLGCDEGAVEPDEPDVVLVVGRSSSSGAGSRSPSPCCRRPPDSRPPCRRP